LFPSLTNVVVSPGIPWDHAVLQVMRQQGLPVCGELSVAWEFSRATPWIGITGTNGKTTVTHLVAHLLERAGLDAPMGGNVGRSAAELMIECQIPGAAVPRLVGGGVEQLPDRGLTGAGSSNRPLDHPHPDHLERHGTLANYRSIKRGLLNRCESRHPQRRRSRSPWPTPPVGTGPTGSLPAGANSCLPVSLP